MQLSFDYTCMRTANWDPLGANVTLEEERYAQDKLQEALREKVKEWQQDRRDIFDYKRHTVYLGRVENFFPRAFKINWKLGLIPVIFDPSIDDCAADTNGSVIRVGKMGFKHRGTTGSLGATFIHEVEHCWDAFQGHYVGGKGHETPRGERQVSEFTPRLRQMLRHLKDEPDFRIWHYLHSKHGYDHALNYADRFLEGGQRYHPTDEEREFAAKAIMKRAKEIFDSMSKEDY